MAPANIRADSRTLGGDEDGQSGTGTAGLGTLSLGMSFFMIPMPVTPKWNGSDPKESVPWSGVSLLPHAR